MSVENHANLSEMQPPAGFEDIHEAAYQADVIEQTRSYDTLRSYGARALAIGALALGVGAAESAVHPSYSSAAAQCTTTKEGNKVTTYCVEEDGSTTEEVTETTNGADNETLPDGEVQIVDATPESIAPPRKEKPIREDKRVRRHPFVSYNQGAWGARIARSGCGPTAVAMTLGTLKGRKNITPAKIAKELTPTYYIPGSGTRPEAFAYMGKKYNVKVQPSGMKGAKKAIEKGGLAIVHAKPGYFTANGHYMVLRATKGDKFRIADPNGYGRHGDSESKWWGPYELQQKGVDKVWTFENKRK